MEVGCTSGADIETEAKPVSENENKGKKYALELEEEKIPLERKCANFGGLVTQTPNHIAPASQIDSCNGQIIPCLCDYQVKIHDITPIDIKSDNILSAVSLAEEVNYVCYKRHIPGKRLSKGVERQMCRHGEQRHQEDEKRLWQQKLQEESMQIRSHHGAREDLMNVRGQRPSLEARDDTVDIPQRNQETRDGVTDTRSQRPRQERRHVSDVRGQQRNRKARKDMLDTRGQRPGQEAGRDGYMEMQKAEETRVPQNST
ncbi:hypothetical protein C0Q70_02232 [Pomacea canaliculata]|uniref:Uncharacterized protein n=1 Tax=Pomacea canaliculata TaxID=400727 RepID=A0A2T7Q1R5_POMCA|nr:hypothetical protein C0Q70_02232 [Pomacea canaliculata]